MDAGAGMAVTSGNRSGVSLALVRAVRMGPTTGECVRARKCSYTRILCRGSNVRQKLDPSNRQGWPSAELNHFDNRPGPIRLQILGSIRIQTAASFLHY